MVIKTDKTLPNFPGSNEERSAFRQALPQILAVCVKNVLLLGFGMTLGFPTILIPSLSGNNPEEKISLGQEAISWIGSINLICVPVGCLMSGAITQPFGRKRSMQFVNIPFLISWLLFHFSTEVWQVFLALCITGVTGGLLEAPVITYVAEITQPSLRGILASTSTVAIISGVLIQFFLGTFFEWRTVALVSALNPIISYLLLFFVPESPHWLISKNRFKDAQKSIAWLRGWADVEDIQKEFVELCRQMSKNQSTGVDNPAFELNSLSKKPQDNVEPPEPSKLETLKLYTRMNVIWPYCLISFIFFLGHFSGMSTLQTYAVKIFSTLKAPIDKYYATIILGVAEVLGCILSASLVYYAGKRVMNFFSLLGCGICFLIVATYAYLIDVKNLETVKYPNNLTDFNNATTDGQYTVLESHNWIPMTFLIAAAFFSHAGIRILPWMLIGEVYSNETRGTISGVNGAMSYVFGFLSNKVFLTMIGTLTLPGTFWFYSSISFIGAIVLYFILPETEGKSLYEITQHFSRNGKLNNKVYREKKEKVKGEVNEGFKGEENKNEQSESRL